MYLLLLHLFKWQKSVKTVKFFVFTGVGAQKHLEQNVI